MKDIVKNFRNIKYGSAPEDSKDVNKWIVNLDKPNYLYINGKWVKSKSTKTIQSINPANNSKLFTLAVANKTDVNAAVLAAKKAHPKWSSLSSIEDQNICMLWHG